MRLADQLCANLYRSVQLFLAHRCLVEEVACAASYLMVDNVGIVAQVVVYAHVYYLQSEAMLATEHVDAAAAVGEVAHLLPGDVARTDAHPFAFNTVVAAKEQVGGVLQGRAERLLHEAQLLCQRL